MKTLGNFIWAIVIVLTILVGIGTTGRLASANDLQSCFVPGEVIESATFSICYDGFYSGETVDIYRITSEWKEIDVTWDNFGGYDNSYSWGAFSADNNPDCEEVDVTDLVQGWINGDYENYGLLLKEFELSTFTRFISSENSELADRPKLEICFAPGDCITIQRPGSEQDGVIDSYIWELPESTDQNFGDDINLYIGRVNGYEKYGLVHFEIPTCEKCWLTAGGVKFSPLANGDGPMATYRGPKDNVGGNVYPGCSPDAGDGGSWTHIAHRAKLHFHGTDITVLKCGNVPEIEPGSESPVTPYNYIEFTGIGTLKGISGNKEDYGTVCFDARAEDRNEPGNEKALGVNGGDDIDRYFLRVYDCVDPTDEFLRFDDGEGYPETNPETITGGNFQIHISSCFN